MLLHKYGISQYADSFISFGPVQTNGYLFFFKKTLISWYITFPFEEIYCFTLSLNSLI